MADRGHWAKIWCAALTDQDLASLSLENFGRWVKLVLLLKQQGTNGSMKFRKDAFILQQAFRVNSDDSVMQVLSEFPNCDVSKCDGQIVVTLRKWHKYQHDSSAERMRKHRNKVTLQEEKRREESKNKKREPTPTPPMEGFERFWKAYPRKKSKTAGEQAWRRLKPTPELQATILRDLEQRTAGTDWNRDGGRFIPHPATYLNQRRWEDEPDARPKTAGQRTAENFRLLEAEADAVDGNV